MSEQEEKLQTESGAQALLNQLVFDFLKEKRRRRVWRFLFRFLVLGLVLWLAFDLWSSGREELSLRANPHVGLIDLDGEIFEGLAASADNFNKGLEKAFDNKSMKALIIRINSPGGSPVQADYMYNSLQYQRKAHPEVKVYAVCVDACASAAYYVAAGADQIYANPSSLVGSIGVLYNGFGFVDAMQKLGISRRLQTAGRNKGFLDPFSVSSPEQTAYLQSMLDTVHQQFIDKVKAGRGAKLKIDDLTFSGLFWAGVQAKERGLIDGFASAGQLAREEIKIDKLVDYTYKETVIERVAKSMGTAMANQLPAAMGMKSGLRA